MFEGTLTESGFDEAAESSGLKPLEWPVLVAQLAAARELRRALATRRVSASGNFARFSTACASEEKINENATRVNPDALVDGKSSAGNVPDIAIETQSGDRE